MKRLQGLAHITIASLLVVCCAFPSIAQTITSALVLRVPEAFGNSPLSPNAVEAMLVEDAWKIPAEGDAVFIGGQRATWLAAKAATDGWFPDSLFATPAYIYTSVDVTDNMVLLLKALGNDIVYVNGAPRPGNPYAYKETYESWETRFDYSILPVELKRGRNHLLFYSSRGRFKATFAPVGKPVQFNPRDVTAPDLVRGTALSAYAALPIINATTSPLRGLRIRYQTDGVSAQEDIPPVLPMSTRKEGFAIHLPASQGESVVLHLTLLQAERTLDTASVTLRVVGPRNVRRETFLSGIDGSVQYFAVAPPMNDSPSPKAMIFTLHGAGVEASGQAAAYEPKTWATIVAPTNRRPYGFNWEDWGRMDALEVLDRSLQEYATDTTRIYLTGHSMGGHGAWQLGGLYPDRWAAVGPSAGWITYWSYRIRSQRGDTSAAARMLHRAIATSETPSFVKNFLGEGLYILHGADDDNVPIQQSYMMVDSLKGVLHDYVFHEQPKEGHWWDESPEPGADCVDWAPMMDYFARHRRPSDVEVREVNFVTANPGVSSRCHWVTVAQQEHPLEISSVRLGFDPGLRRFSGSTANVLCLGLDLKVLPPGDSIHIAIDSTRLDVRVSAETASMLWLKRVGEQWHVSSPPDPASKSPERYGPFKDAFRNRAVLVYATHGTAEENRLVLERVRYDEERFWYQGNGSLDVLADRDCSESAIAGRNVILYGNANINSAWKNILAATPVSLREHAVEISGKSFVGDDLCAVFLRPRSGSPSLSVGVVGATGAEGFRLLNRVQYFNSYLGVPDLLVLQADAVKEGERGLVCTGFFGNDWSVEHGEFVWSDDRQ